MNVLKLGYMPSNKELFSPNAIIDNGLAITHMIPLAKEIQKQGINQSFYSANAKLFGKKENIKGFTTYRTSFPQTPLYLPYGFGLIFKIKEIQKDTGKIDIIHSHNPAYAYIYSIPLLNLFLPKKPIVITWHGTFPFKTVEYPFLKSLIKKAYFIAISLPSKEQIISLGANPDRVKLITTGVDADFFYSKSKEKKDLLFVGRFVKSKNIDTLIKAFKIVTEKHPKIKLNLVGDGPLKEELQTLTKELGLEAKINFLGSLSGEDLVKAYSTALICVFPHLHESFGKVVIEAMSCKTPVIGTNFDIPPNMKDKGVFYDYKQATNSKALSQKVLELLEDNNLRNSLQIQARNTVLEYYSWKAIATQTKEYYKEILEREQR